MVVWCIPGDDVGVLHASALFVERKFPDASQQPDEAHGKASAQVPSMVKTCVLPMWFLQLGVFSKVTSFLGPGYFPLKQLILSQGHVQSTPEVLDNDPP